MGLIISFSVQSPPFRVNYILSNIVLTGFPSAFDSNSVRTYYVVIQSLVFVVLGELCCNWVSVRELGTPSSLSSLFKLSSILDYLVTLVFIRHLQIILKVFS